jgi:hypothetical protein
VTKGTPSSGLLAYEEGNPFGAAMILTLFLSYFSRPPRYVWSPALDVNDPQLFSTLLPGVR